MTQSTTQQSSTGILFHSAALFFWILVCTYSPIWASASHFPRVPWMSEFSSLAHSLFLTINIRPGYLCLSPVPSHIETISGNSKLIVQLRKCSNSAVQSWYGSSVDSIPIPMLKQRRFLYRSARLMQSPPFYVLRLIGIFTKQSLLVSLSVRRRFRKYKERGENLYFLKRRRKQVSFQFFPSWAYDCRIKLG